MHNHSVQHEVVTAVHVANFLVQITTLICWVHSSIGDLTRFIFIVPDKLTGEAIIE